MPTVAQIKGKLKFYSKPYGRQWKWRYQKDGAFFEPKLQIPKELIDRNVEIIDPLHPKPVERLTVDKWMPPRRHPILESFFPKPTQQQHPNYHEKPTFLFDRSVKLHAGVPQACLLTKTMPIEKLPQNIISNIGKFSIKGQDENLKAYIKQALAFDPSKDMNPRITIPKDIKFKLARSYATTDYMQSFIILDNMIRLCNSSAVENAVSNKLLSNIGFHTSYQRADEMIHIRRKCDLVLFSKKALNSIADRQTLDQSLGHDFMDMYPIFPTIDMKSEHLYEDHHNYGLATSSAFKNIHTVFLINKDTLDSDTDIAQLIMYAFGYANAQYELNKESKKLGENGELLEPIVVNAVSMTFERLNFVTYQLNTLNLKNNAGVKNIAYVDKDNKLYLNRPNVNSLPYPSKKNIQRYALRHLEYNPDAFEKFKSVVLNDSPVFNKYNRS